MLCDYMLQIYRIMIHFLQPSTHSKENITEWCSGRCRKSSVRGISCQQTAKTGLCIEPGKINSNFSIFERDQLKREKESKIN